MPIERPQEGGENPILRSIGFQPLEYRGIHIPGDILKVTGKFPVIHHLLGGLGGEQVVGSFRRITFDQVLFSKTITGSVNKTQFANIFFRYQVSFHKKIDKFRILNDRGGDHLLVDGNALLGE
jgi:hypothetical protein